MQLPWPGLPDVWQLAGNFSLSLRAHGDEAGEEEKGVGETDLDLGAVEPHGDKAPAGGKAEGSLATYGPDRDELIHGGHQKL